MCNSTYLRLHFESTHNSIHNHSRTSLMRTRNARSDERRPSNQEATASPRTDTSPLIDSAGARFPIFWFISFTSRSEIHHQILPSQGLRDTHENGHGQRPMRTCNTILFNSASQQHRDGDDWHLKSVILECEILQIAIDKEVSELQANRPNLVARAKLRGMIQTLTEKVWERKLLARHQRTEDTHEHF